MKQNNYRGSITVNVDAGKAFDAICQVTDWWTENLEGSTANLNDSFTVHFGDSFVNFEITEAVPGRKLVWYVTDCNLNWLNEKKEWKDTSVSWEISADADSTIIDMEHIGLSPEFECFNDCVKGWDHYIKDSLFKLITENQGLPQKRKEVVSH